MSGVPSFNEVTVQRVFCFLSGGGKPALFKICRSRNFAWDIVNFQIDQTG